MWVGEEGKGIRAILSHAHLTRLDFAIGSAGLMRQALTLALHPTSTRRAFGSPISDRSIMTNVLADMAVEIEAATLLALRVARATDDLDTNEQERLLARIATPAAKLFNCSRAPSIAYECLQCHGGNGFIEENPMMCMDVRRPMTKDPNTIEPLFQEVKPLKGQDSRYDVLIQELVAFIQRASGDEFYARAMTKAVARLLQGAEPLRHSTPEVIDLFFETRCSAQSSRWGSHYGTLAGSLTQQVASKIMQRAMVANS